MAGTPVQATRQASVPDMDRDASTDKGRSPCKLPGRVTSGKAGMQAHQVQEEGLCIMDVTLMTTNMDIPEKENVIDVRRTVRLAEAILKVWLGLTHHAGSPQSPTARGQFDVNCLPPVALFSTLCTRICCRQFFKLR